MRFMQTIKMVSFRIAVAACFILLASEQTVGAEKLSSGITVNQLGYLPNGYKMAIVNTDAKTFSVRDTQNDKVVFQAGLNEPQRWASSGELVKIADFTKLSKPGRYYIDAEGARSYDFEISNSVYDPLCKASLRYFYYNRASTDIEPQFGGQWHRKAGHPDDKVKVHSSAASETRSEGTVISCPKGWYDAGDYNKYVVNSGIATSTLLSLYEAYPTFMKQLSLNIPESDNDVPDVLDEVFWNIQWLLTMQDPSDGGVYHKLTTLNFSGFIMPHEAAAQRYVVQKSTSAALNFAAVMAQASRVYSAYETQFPGLSKQCLDQARQAWRWARKNPAVYYTGKQPEGIQTGAYGDNDVQDEFCWAAIELYLTTGDDTYYEQSKIDSVPIQSASWSQTSLLAYISMIHNKNRLTSAVDFPFLQKRFLAYADDLFSRYLDCAYRITNEHFIWGSNAVCMNETVALLVAYELTGDGRYFEAAQANLGYILGRNPLNHSFVTGFGKLTPMHVHHRISSADGITEPIPGMMVGGPNNKNPGDCEADKYKNYDRPALAYLDDQCSYSTNEVAINWNAPLAYVVCAISANTQHPSFSQSLD